MKNERPVDIRNRPRIPVPDEDPYSVAGDGLMKRKTSSDFIDLFVCPGSGSSGSSGVRERSKDKPPKLPPRDSIYGPHGPHNIPKVSISSLIATLLTAGPRLFLMSSHRMTGVPKISGIFGGIVFINFHLRRRKGELRSGLRGQSRV